MFICPLWFARDMELHRDVYSIQHVTEEVRRSGRVISNSISRVIKRLVQEESSSSGVCGYLIGFQFNCRTHDLIL